MRTQQCNGAFGVQKQGELSKYRTDPYILQIKQEFAKCKAIRDDLIQLGIKYRQIDSYP